MNNRNNEERPQRHGYRSNKMKSHQSYRDFPEASNSPRDIARHRGGRGNFHGRVDRRPIPIRRNAGYPTPRNDRSLHHNYPPNPYEYNNHMPHYEGRGFPHDGRGYYNPNPHYSHAYANNSRRGGRSGGGRNMSSSFAPRGMMPIRGGLPRTSRNTNSNKFTKAPMNKSGKRPRNPHNYPRKKYTNKKHTKHNHTSYTPSSGWRPLSARKANTIGPTSLDGKVGKDGSSSHSYDSDEFTEFSETESYSSFKNPGSVKRPNLMDGVDELGFGDDYEGTFYSIDDPETGEAGDQIRIRDDIWQNLEVDSSITMSDAPLSETLYRPDSFDWDAQDVEFDHESDYGRDEPIVEMEHVPSLPPVPDTSFTTSSRRFAGKAKTPVEDKTHILVTRIHELENSVAELKAIKDKNSKLELELERLKDVEERNRKLQEELESLKKLHAEFSSLKELESL